MISIFKKIGLIIAAISLALFSLTFTQSALAVTQSGFCNDSTLRPTGTVSVCKDNQQDKAQTNPIFGEGSLGMTILNLITWATGIVSVIMIIIGGFRYVLSGGDSNGIQGAKNTIIYALVGLVVAIFGQVIISFVLSKLQ